MKNHVLSQYQAKNQTNQCQGYKFETYHSQAMSCVSFFVVCQKSFFTFQIVVGVTFTIKHIMLKTSLFCSLCFQYACPILFLSSGHCVLFIFSVQDSMSCSCSVTRTKCPIDVTNPGKFALLSPGKCESLN